MQIKESLMQCTRQCIAHHSAAKSFRLGAHLMSCSAYLLRGSGSAVRSQLIWIWLSLLRTVTRACAHDGEPHAAFVTTCCQHEQAARSPLLCMHTTSDSMCTSTYRCMGILSCDVKRLSPCCTTNVQTRYFVPSKSHVTIMVHDRRVTSSVCILRRRCCAQHVRKLAVMQSVRLVVAALRTPTVRGHDC